MSLSKIVYDDSPVSQGKPPTPDEWVLFGTGVLIVVGLLVYFVKTLS